MKRALLFVPLGIFIVLVVVLAAGFGLDDPHNLPSQLVGRPLPAFSLQELGRPDRKITERELVGQVAMLNVWATWCPSCAAEHKELLRIAGEGVVRLVGIDYNDDTHKAEQWLAQLGNPYSVVISDSEGSLGIDLGVYGAPETFVIDADGTIRYRHVGPVTRQVWLETLRPLVMDLSGNVVPIAGATEGGG